MSKVIGAIGFVLFVLVMIAAGAAFLGWLVMLLAGILYHADIIESTLPFTTSCVIGLILSLILGAIKGN